MNEKYKKVRSFWDEQARVYSTDLKATTPDPLLKMLEIKALRSVVDPNKDTLEIGCVCKEKCGRWFNCFFSL